MGLLDKVLNKKSDEKVKRDVGSNYDENEANEIFDMLDKVDSKEAKKLSKNMQKEVDISKEVSKLLKEAILSQKFMYTENKLYEINFQNVRCTYDTNKNLYITKKKSKGKVDMVVSTLNALCLLQKDALLGQMDFVIQTL